MSKVFAIAGSQLPPLSLPKQKQETPEQNGLDDNSQTDMSLHECVRNGRLGRLRKMMEAEETKESINDLDEEGLSPLHYAVRGNNAEAMEILLRDGEADPMVKDDEKASPLHYICRRKVTLTVKSEPVKLVDMLMKYNCDVADKDRYHSTPLHFCAMRDNLPVAEALLKTTNAKDYINELDKLGCTPLHEAATYNNHAVARLLIKYGADATLSDDEGCTPLHLAAMEGKHDVLSVILEHASQHKHITILSRLIGKLDNEGTTALHYAIENRNLENVQLLVQHGADVNARCRPERSGSSPLHLAAIAGEENVFAYLIQQGARADARDNRQCTPLHNAAQYSSIHVVMLLLKQSTVELESLDTVENTPLMAAVAYGNPDVLQTLLDNDANVQVHDCNEKSVFYKAVENDHSDVLKVLLKHMKRRQDLNLLINFCDKHNDSPLHVAASRGNLEIAELLMNNFANLRAKNEDEETPFLIACSKGRIRIVQEMLQRNEMLINDEDEESNTGLHMAADAGYLAVVRYLVKRGAQKDARNNHFHTPLDLAAMKGHLDIVCYLLDDNVSPNTVDRERETPLQMASRNGHASVVATLIERGSDVSKTNVNGKNCLDIAIEAEQRDVVENILNSKAWKVALCNDSGTDEETERNCASCTHNTVPRDTPLRKLCRMMPDMASLAMDKCILRSADSNRAATKNQVIFNYDLIDDTYTNYDDLLNTTGKGKQKKKTDFFQWTEDRYSSDANYIKHNHPLAILVEQGREDLLGHPLILSLIRHKWRKARIVYFIYILFYLLYVILVTSFMLIATPPYKVNMTDCDMADENSQPVNEIVLQIMIWIMAAIGLTNELFQLFLKRWTYFGLINLLDWFSYISTMILMVTLTNCGIRTDWQWQLGAFTLLFTWLDLILFLRRLPGHGLYVVMITEICRTFIQFFITLMLFIIAFALAFYVLLMNQPEFDTELKAIVKSFVMMIGEFNYVAFFFNDDESRNAIYDTSVYVVFVLFAFLVSVIVMNLLVGLAVSDVNGLRRQAKVIKLSLQIDLALDIELALPSSLARWCKFNITHQKFNIKKYYHTFGARLLYFLEGPLLSEWAIAEALATTNLDASSSKVKASEPNVQQELMENKKDVADMSMKVDEVFNRLEKLEHMLGKIYQEVRSSRHRHEHY